MRGAALGLALDEAEVLQARRARRVVRPRPPRACAIMRRANVRMPGERVVDLVRDGRRELAERGELLALDERLLGLLSAAVRSSTWRSRSSAAALEARARVLAREAFISLNESAEHPELVRERTGSGAGVPPSARSFVAASISETGRKTSSRTIAETSAVRATSARSEPPDDAPGSRRAAPVVHVAQRERDVEEAEDALVLRRSAWQPGRGARGLVVDGRHEREDAVVARRSRSGCASSGPGS